MKTKAITKLKALTPQKLKKKLDQAQTDLVNLRLKIKAGREKDLHAAKKKRREIAIIKTLLNEKKESTK